MDNKFISQFDQAFIAPRENSEVLDWKLTKPTAFSEIENILCGIKKRLHVAMCGTNIIKIPQM